MTAFKFHNIGSPKHQGNHPDDEGSKHLWNVSKLLPDYMVQQPKIQPSPMPFLLKKFTPSCSIRQNSIFRCMCCTINPRKWRQIFLMQIKCSSLVLFTEHKRKKFTMLVEPKVEVKWKMDNVYCMSKFCKELVQNISNILLLT
jgi:hypothetical protein